jgi:3-hydroxyacyl-[acyl-carrier-protein] dehydratase
MLRRPMRFLMVDRITSMEPPLRARGIKCVSLSEDVFADHFTGWPILPGAFLVEALAQLAGALLDESAARDGEATTLAMMVGVDRARFRRQVVPGDQLALLAEVEQRSADGARARVEARVGEELAADAVLTFVLARDVPADFVAERGRIRAVMQRGRWWK